MQYLKNILIFAIISILFSCDSDDGTNTNSSSCDEGLLLVQSIQTIPSQVSFLLDSISKPVSPIIMFSNIKTDLQQSFYGTVTTPSNYSAFDKTNTMFFLETPTEQRLYKYDIVFQTRQEFIVSGFYSAPIFSNGTLYGLEVDFNNFGVATNPANFKIQIINQNDGSVATANSGNFPLLSSFNWLEMSSAYDGNSKLYFISGTNLVNYDVANNTSSHTELVPTYDLASNNQKFYGLEYRNNGNLLAIRSRNDNIINSLQLVEIDINNLSALPIVIYDFGANSIDINLDYYSTAYDSCDDNYYITSGIVSNSTSNFYKLDISVGIIDTQISSNFLMGLESKNK